MLAQSLSSPRPFSLYKMLAQSPASSPTKTPAAPATAFSSTGLLRRREVKEVGGLGASLLHYQLSIVICGFGFNSKTDLTIESWAHHKALDQMKFSASSNESD
ncbi:hypothetical protein CsSME_00001335 [Camellia sinensis var. sinensis]